MLIVIFINGVKSIEASDGYRLPRRLRFEKIKKEIIYPKAFSLNTWHTNLILYW
jgi:hypothetical protein